MSIEELLLILVTIVIVALVFYASGALVGRDWGCTGPYALRLAVVAVVTVIVIPVFRDASDSFDLGELGVVVAFVLLIFLVRNILVDELTVSDDWQASIIISLLGVVMLFIIEAIALAAFDLTMFALF